MISLLMGSDDVRAVGVIENVAKQEEEEEEKEEEEEEEEEKEEEEEEEEEPYPIDIPDIILPTKLEFQGKS